MDNERDLRNEFHIALDAVLPPVPWLEAAVRRDLRRQRQHSLPEPERATRPFRRLTLQWAGGLVAALLALALLAGLLYLGSALRWQVIPASPLGHALAGGGGMVSPTVGWLDTNGEGHIVRTTDGGATWTDVTPDSFIYEALGGNDFFLDTVHAWDTELIRGSPDSLPSASSRVTTFQTVDGGRSWITGTSITLDRDVSFIRLYFLDPSHGWLLAGQNNQASDEADELFRTVDGGLNWRPVAENVLGNRAGLGCGWNTIAFASTSVGWMIDTCDDTVSSDYQRLLVTHDGGATWSAQQLPRGIGASCPCDTPVVFDPTHLMVVVAASSPAPAHREVLMTDDAGASWSTRALPGEVQLGVDFIDAQHGWTIAGSASTVSRDSTGQFPTLPGVNMPLYRTDDGGRTWVPVPTSVALDSSEGRIQGFTFVDLQNGFAERVTHYPSADPYNPTGQTTQLLKTTDGGRTWRVVGAIPLGW